MANKPQTRKEKIEFLKKLAVGKARIQDIVPAIKLCIFEISPGRFTGLILDPPYNVEISGLSSNYLSNIVKHVKKQCERQYPDHLFEHSTLYYDEIRQLREFAEKEF